MTPVYYTDGVDIHEKCRAEFGPDARPADWMFDFRNMNVNQILQIVDGLGIPQTCTTQQVYITYNGYMIHNNHAACTPTGSRYYFGYRGDESASCFSNFFQNIEETIYLGAWCNGCKPILCIGGSDAFETGTRSDTCEDWYDV